MLCLHQLFEAAVDRSPEAIALIDGTTEVSYAELERRANQLARHLRRLGVGPEKLVGICTARSADMVVGLLGVLKTGGAYLALDPAYPRERLAFMLADAAAPVVLTRERLLDRFQDLGATVAVCLDRDAAALDAECPQRLSSAAGPGSLAYLIYTSGSTGRPKGVAIEHRSAVALCHWARATFPAEDLAAMLASTSINFDLSVFEIFVPLAGGGTVILAENALALPRLPAAGRVRFVNTVPSAIAELIRADGLPPSVRTVGLAGEPLQGVLVERIYAGGTVQGVYNLYGPSEDTTYSTWTRVERGSPGEPTIGRPVTGTEIHLLDPGDPAMVPVAPGIPGEVHLGGAGLARGYLGRPELTAERFLPDPFSGRPGARLYRVGDLGLLLPGGEVQYLGRVDHQVKIRGFRIELGEIEAVLSRHPKVLECVVIARESTLVAYVVLSDPSDHPSNPSDASSLRAWLAEKLPGYMVPSLFVVLDALPRTPNGKVDRKALPEPAGTARPDEASTAPRTPMEELVAGLWCEVLGTERVGLHDNFLDLGGHSLLAARLISRLRDTLGVEIDLPTLFSQPTVAGTAEAVERTRGGMVRLMPPLVPVPRDGDLRASLMQTRQWFLDQLQPGSPVNNIGIAAQLSGPLRPELLERGLREIVRRHETLRTTFEERGGAVLQRIDPSADFDLPLLDLSALPEDAREAELERVSSARAATPFDLRRGPVLRVDLLRLGREEHRLLAVLHHIVSDDWSVWVLFHELGLLYRAFSTGAPHPLPDPPALQYADFAAWQNGWLETEGAMDEFLAHARHLVADVTTRIDLPTDRPRPSTPTFQGRLYRFVLPSTLAPPLRELARREGATLFMALLTAFEVQIARLTARERFLVASPTAGRNRTEVEGLIGFFNNTAVWRADLAGRPGFRTLLRRVRDAVLDGSRFDALPFERIPAALRLAGDAYNPLFQVLFALQTVPRPEPELAPGLRVRTWEMDTGTAKVELSLFLWNDEGLTGAIEFRTDLFDESTIRRMAGQYQQILEEMLAAPDEPVAEIDLVAAPERRQILEERIEAPRGTLEELIAGVWEQALGVESVGLHQSFFALGGHSLLATRIAMRLRDLLHVEIPFRTLFERPTVAGLAQALQEGRRAVRQASITPGHRGERPPLSFDQQRLWFLERLDPGTAVFNIPALFALRGPLDATALRRALAEIIRRHEALRTTISGRDEEAWQAIHPPSVPALPAVDLSGLPAERRAREAGRVVDREVRRPLDLERGPLVRFLLIRSAADDHLFLALFHHLIADGGSLTLFEQELAALYGGSSPLPDLPVQFADYAAWQRAGLSGGALEARLAYWRERLAAPLPILRLPTDRPRPEVPSPRGALVQTILPAELTAGVRELSRREGSTLYITLLAAFLALLHRATGQCDVLLGTPVSHRDRSEVEGLIGMFVNTLVLRAEARPEASFRQHLAHVRERALEAFAHQSVPFERLVDELRPERGPHDTPFFQLMFTFQPPEEPARTVGGLELRPLAVSTGTAQFELTLSLTAQGKDLLAEIEYRTELFERSTIEAMLDAYQDLLAAAVADPDLPLAALPLRRWLTAAPSPATAPPSPRPSTEEADAAREAQLATMRSGLSDAQRDLLRQRLQRLKR